MTALEEQLTRALRMLSAQYDKEQRRHSEQVEVLQRQVEALQGHVERQSEENEALRMRIERLDVLATRLAEYSGISTGARPRGRGW